MTLVSPEEIESEYSKSQISFSYEENENEKNDPKSFFKEYNFFSLFRYLLKVKPHKNSMFRLDIAKLKFFSKKQNPKNLKNLKFYKGKILLAYTSAHPEKPDILALVIDDKEELKRAIIYDKNGQILKIGLVKTQKNSEFLQKHT